MISDLIYCENVSQSWCQEMIKKNYLTAKFADASDEIHTSRFSVDITDVEKKDWYIFLFINGLALNSLWFEMDMHGQNVPLIKQILAEYKDKVVVHDI